MALSDEMGVREGASGGGVMASPLEIGEGTPLELGGEGAGVYREISGMYREFVCWGLASSCGKVLGVVVWCLVGDQ